MKTLGRKGGKHDESVEQSRDDKVQRFEECTPATYADAYGYAEMRRSVYLPLQVIT